MTASRSFAFFCKTFAPDIERFARLLASVERYCRSEIPFIVSVPSEHAELFRNRFGSGRFQLILDEDVLGRHAQQGWRTQQLVKLYATKLGFAESWMILDSDYYFVRDFSLSDFVKGDSVALPVAKFLHCLDDFEPQVKEYMQHGERAPLTVAQLREWRSDAPLPTSFTWQSLSDRLFKPSALQRLPRIQRFFGRRGVMVQFMPAPIWTRSGCDSFSREVLEPRGWTYETLIRHSPWEAIWIGEWELYRGMPGRHLVETLFLHIYKDKTILKARADGLNEAKVAQHYLGMNLAARHQELLRLDEENAN